MPCARVPCRGSYVAWHVAMCAPRYSFPQRRPRRPLWLHSTVSLPEGGRYSYSYIYVLYGTLYCVDVWSQLSIRARTRARIRIYNPHLVYIGMQLEELERILAACPRYDLLTISPCR